MRRRSANSSPSTGRKWWTRRRRGSSWIGAEIWVFECGLIFSVPMSGRVIGSAFSGSESMGCKPITRPN